MALFMRASYAPKQDGFGLISSYRISRISPVSLDWTSSTPRLVASVMALGRLTRYVTAAILLTLYQFRRV